MQHQSTEDWLDPQVKIFDPEGNLEHQIDNVEINRDLDGLMEENMNEIENNFPGTDKILSQRYRVDFDIVEELAKHPHMLAPYPGKGILQPEQIQTDPGLPTLQTAPVQLNALVKSNLVESLGSSFQEISLNQAELETPGYPMFLADLDQAAVDFYNQTSRYSQVSIEVPRDSGSSFLSQKLDDILGVVNTESKLATNPDHGGGFDCIHNKCLEECEISTTEEASPSAVYDRHMFWRGKSRLPNQIGASRQLFYDEALTKASAEPLHILPRSVAWFKCCSD